MDFKEKGAFVISRENEYLQFSDREVFTPMNKLIAGNFNQELLCIDELNLAVYFEVDLETKYLTMMVWNTKAKIRADNRMVYKN